METRYWRGTDSICRDVRHALWLFAWVVLTSLHVAPSASAQDPAVRFAERSEEEILILAVRVNNQRASDGIIAYQMPDGALLLPLGELARLTTLAIEPDPDRGRASGFIISEERSFLLDAVAGTVQLGGVTAPYPPAQVEVHEDDLYVRASLIEEWWPVEIETDLQNLLLNVVSTELLPFELRQKRSFRGQLLDAQSSATGLRYPLLPDPYALWQVPVINLETRLSLDRNDDESRADLLYTLGAAGDLLGTSARLFISGSDDDPFGLVRGTVGRWDPDGGLLGPLRATLAEGGEVHNPGSELLLRSTSGPGVHVTNYPLYVQDRLESHTFRGEIPPGWEVELYQNEVLVGFDQSGTDGQYAFTDIPLIAGFNVFRLVFYGPRGETREEVVRFNLLDTLPDRGELLYRVVANDARSADNRALTELEYGLGNLSSVRVSAAYEETPRGEDAGYFKGDYRRAFGAFFLTGSLASDEDANLAAQARVSGRIARFNVSLDHVQADGFTSEDLISPFGALESRTEAALDGPLGRIGGSLFNNRLEVMRDDVERGGAGYTLNHRLSTNVQRFFVSNLLERRWASGDLAFADTTRGVMLLSRPSRILGMRGEIGYELEPEVMLRSAAVTADVGRWRPFVVQVGINRIEVPETLHQLQVNLQRRGEEVSWGLNLIADDDGNTTAMLTASATAIFEPRSRDWILRGDVAQGTAAITVEVFVDENGDGLRDPGEPPLPGVEVFVGRLSYDRQTDEEGRLVITNLSPFRDTEITLSRSTLPEPTMVPLVEGHAVRLRPGRTMTLSFPVIMTGEITGTVYAADGEPIGGVAVELVSDSGEVVRRTFSAYDGFFELLEVPIGDYVLRAQRRGLEAAQELSISTTEPFVDGADLRLAAQ